MNEHKKPRGHKAHNDKDSILADAKNLLYILHPAIQRMPKIDRIEGAPVEMKRATQNGIHGRWRDDSTRPTEVLCAQSVAGTA